MRGSALAGLLALVAAGAACGRVGYDPIVADDDAGPDAPPDTADGFIETPCDQPVMIADLGPPAATPPGRYKVDVAATATGMVAVYALGDGQLHATAWAVDTDGAVQLIQSRGHVLDTTTSDFAVAALGDLVELAVDDPVNSRMALLDLSEYGYSRGGTAYVDTKRGAGHDFITADPERDHFVVTGLFGNDAYSWAVDHDGDTISGHVAVITGGSLVPEGAGAIRHGAGYAVFAGTTSECTVVPYDESWVASGPPRTVAMTCHNLSLASAPGSSNVLPAWNCDNDSVWVTAGDVVADVLPAERAVFGDGSMSASDPRVAVTSDGIWYAYAVAGGRLGRTLLDATGRSLPSAPPADVHQSVRVVAHDLVARASKAFLVWLETGAPNDSLHVMRLCP